MIDSGEKHSYIMKYRTKPGTDLFEIFSKSYLIVVDYTSFFFNISEITDKRSSTVVLHTKRIFFRYGIPEGIITENGPEFIGNAYKRLSKKWNFKHTTSSPVHPQSNRQVERTVQTIKTTLYKVFENTEDPYLAYFPFDQHIDHQVTHLLPLSSLTKLYEQ